MAEEKLSNQDLLDLEEIRKRLPAGDPRLAKIDALKQASNAVPTEFERERGVGEDGQQPGVLKSTFNTLKKVPEGMLQVFGGPQAGSKLAIRTMEDDENRSAEGRSLPYRAVAGTGEMLGVDTGAMEDAAEHANTRGVVGAGIGSALPYLLPSAGRAVRVPIGEALKSRAEVPYNKVLGLKGRESFYSNPGRGLAREGFVAGSKPSLLEKIENTIPERSAQADEVLNLPQHRAIRMNIAQAAGEPFDAAISAGTGDLGTASESTLNRIQQTKNELMMKREREPGGGFRFTGRKNLEAISPADATAFKRNIYERTNYRNPEFDESVNDTLRRSAHGVKTAINGAVPEVAPFNERVSDLIGGRDALQKRILSRQISPTSSGFSDVAPSVIGTAGGGPVAGAVAVAGKRAIMSTPLRTMRGAAMYKLGNALSPDAPLNVPEPRQPMPTPIRGLLGTGPIRLGSSMEPIDATTTAPGPIDWGTRATRTGRLLPEHASMPRPIRVGSQMEPIEDVGPISQPAASDLQGDRKMFTTSPKLPRGIRLPESPYGFGPDEEESEIEQARRR